jgi:hypothetical protein
MCAPTEPGFARVAIIAPLPKKGSKYVPNEWEKNDIIFIAILCLFPTHFINWFLKEPMKGYLFYYFEYFICAPVKNWCPSIT